MTLEMGKPLAEAHGEVGYGAEFLRWFGEEAPRISGRYSTAPDGANRLLVTRRPVGTVPVHHTVELPARHGDAQDRTGHRRGVHDGPQARRADSIEALLLTEVLEDAGLPPGVLNVIPTTDPRR